MPPCVARLRCFGWSRCTDSARGFDFRYAYSFDAGLGKAAVLRTPVFLRRSVTLVVLEMELGHGTGFLSNGVVALFMAPRGFQPVLFEVTRQYTDSGTEEYREDLTGSYRFAQMQTDSPTIGLTFKETLRLCGEMKRDRSCAETLATSARWNETLVWHAATSTFYDVRSKAHAEWPDRYREIAAVRSGFAWLAEAVSKGGFPAANDTDLGAAFDAAYGHRHVETEPSAP